MSPEAFDTFQRTHPGAFLLDPSQPGTLAGHLIRLGWLDPDEPLRSLGPAGEGNMNCTVRAVTDRRTFIVKQARPWVEKYPQFAAPWDRALTEAAFYLRVAYNPAVAGLMPRLLGHDPESRLLLLEDLGTRGDLSSAYRDPSRLRADLIRSLAGYLCALHAGFPAPSGPSPLPNREMRALNHAHIFRIPFQPEAWPDLAPVLPGLEAVAAGFRNDDALRDAVAALGDSVYLTDGPCLLHGDFFPGSFLDTPDGPRVIDPEFCFFGRPEWDAGVFVAHLVLAGAPEPVHAAWWRAYRPPAGFQPRLAHQLAGAEILRRILGYAQLPLGSDLATRKAQLERARAWVLEPPDPVATTAPAP